MKTLLIPLSLIALLITGCASMKAEMALPESLQGIEPQPIQNRRMLELGSKPMFDFGGWQVTQFRRGWTRESVANLFWTETVDRTQRYSFVLTGASQPVDVLCGARADMDRWGTDEDGLSRVHAYELRCEGLPVGSEESLFTLEVGTRVGHLEWAGERLLVVPTNDLAGSSWKFQARTGYVIEDDDGEIAAVEILSPGRVWIHPEVVPDLRDVLAAVSSALLLYDDLLE